jgi:enamine deaminase RidA (YjgF/YER057c/UK114 family)
MTTPIFFDTPGFGEIARAQYSLSMAVRIGDRVEISGHGGWDDDFTFSVESLEAEIEKTFDNIEKTLNAAGAAWGDVVSVHTYHVPTAEGSIGEDHMSAVADQLRKRAGGHLPVWTALGVKALGIPEMHIEVEVVAIVGADDK